jgi:lipid-A-disaccharide synthase
MPRGRALRVFISAGEPSGDLLGARLISALRRRAPEGIEIDGIGGESMAREGLESLFPLSELAVMGLLEVIPHIPRLKRRIKEAAVTARRFDPDVLVTIDAPGFNKRLAAALGRTEFPKVHYVAPTVWAWRPNRVHSFKALFDALLCLLPFEPPYFEKVGLSAPFVGHSVLEGGADRGDGAKARSRYGIAPATPVLCVLPGSRTGEIERLLPVFRDAVDRVAVQHAGLRVLLPTVDHQVERVRDGVSGWSVRCDVVTGERSRFDAMAASDAALAASGTVALELAMARVPTVVAYRLNPLTNAIVRRLVRTDYAHLLNILLGEAVVPERLQGDCDPDTLARDVVALLGPEGKKQVDRIVPALDRLRPPGDRLPSEAAADEILRLVAEN